MDIYLWLIVAPIYYLAQIVMWSPIGAVGFVGIGLAVVAMIERRILDAA